MDTNIAMHVKCHVYGLHCIQIMIKKVTNAKVVSFKQKS